MTAESGRTAAPREKVRTLTPRAERDLTELVPMRSVADPRRSPPEECARSADFLVRAFTGARLRDMRRVPAPDGTDAVLGHAPEPEGAPTVLPYPHYGVRPPPDEDARRTPSFEPTGRDGRRYGLGAADREGAIAMHLTAPGGPGGRGFPARPKSVAEGSEERGAGGLEQPVPLQPDLFTGDAPPIRDTGDFARGLPLAATSPRGPTDVTVSTLKGAPRSGMFGDPAPDVLAAPLRTLGSLRDEHGDTAAKGLPGDGLRDGADHPAERFRTDAGVLDGVCLVGTGPVAEGLWERPAVTVPGIDRPPVVGPSAAVQARGRAEVRAEVRGRGRGRGRGSLRVPPGVGADADEVRHALADHLVSAAPWDARVEEEPEGFGRSFRARTGGPAHRAVRLAAAPLREAYGTDTVQSGQDGPISLYEVLARRFPGAEAALIGVEEPGCPIHAPNESVGPRRGSAWHWPRRSPQHVRDAALTVRAPPRPAPPRSLGRPFHSTKGREPHDTDP
ncbi:dipeptidase [Streptomyces sp. NPDC088557]|uniref:dipeptidase n=1 Tax=Streptomyces sp. NPDC088557 TaxID=3365867 RepID=UPI00381902B0